MRLYTIQEFADRSGVSIDRLRHYEKLNLLKPQRNMRNGYRYYSDEHLPELCRICFLQSLNVQLKDIPEVLGSQGVKARIAQRIIETEAEMTRLRMQMERLSDLCGSTEHEEDVQGRNDAARRLYVLFYDQIAQHEQAKNVVAQWMRLAPFVRTVFEIGANAANAPVSERLQPRMGLAIEARYADELGLGASAAGVVVRESRAIPCRIRLADPLHPAAAELADVFTYCSDNGISPDEKLLYHADGEETETGYTTQVFISRGSAVG